MQVRLAQASRYVKALYSIPGELRQDDGSWLRDRHHVVIEAISYLYTVVEKAFARVTDSQTRCSTFRKI